MIKLSNIFSLENISLNFIAYLSSAKGPHNIYQGGGYGALGHGTFTFISLFNHGTICFLTNVGHGTNNFFTDICYGTKSYFDRYHRMLCFFFDICNETSYSSFFTCSGTS